MAARPEEARREKRLPFFTGSWAAEGRRGRQRAAGAASSSAMARETSSAQWGTSSSSESSSAAAASVSASAVASAAVSCGSSLSSAAGRQMVRRWSASTHQRKRPHATRHSTGGSSSASVRTKSPLAPSHRKMLPSADADATSPPSTAASPVTRSECSSCTATHSKSAADSARQTRIWEPEAVHMRGPLQTIAETEASWARKEPTAS
mmetsp:Transcript_10164/g.41373  ORF Transcript_10164/g.41373 Transcript_10164/m.41373 type:complete len:207 (-) Transcript_10164:627-1247(-)